MRRTQWVELFRTIQRTWMLFIGISVVAAIGVMAFLTLQFSVDAQLRTADAFYTDGKMFDLEISCPDGLGGGALSALSSLDGVGAVSGVRAADGLLRLPQERRVVRAMTFSGTVNAPAVTEGRLPEAADECAVDISLYRNDGVRVGDTLTLDTRGADGQPALAGDTLTVTGVFISPLFTRLDSTGDRGMTELGNGIVHDLLLVPDTAMRPEAFPSGYTTAYLRLLDTEDISSFTDAYGEIVRDARARVLALPGASGWSVSTREESPGHIMVRASVYPLRELGAIASAIFLAVAIAVCYFSVSRIAEERRPLIGAQKALGFTPGEIRARYTLYAFCSVTVSLLAGIPLGTTVLQRVMLHIWNVDTYVFDRFVLTSDIPMVALCAAVVYGAMGLTAMGALHRFNRQPAVALLRGTPGAGQRLILLERFRPLWRRLKAIDKASIKNALMDRSRVFTVILCAAGCMALLVMAFQLRYPASSAMERQTKTIMPYEDRVMIDVRRNPEGVEDLRAVLADTAGVSALGAREARVYLSGEAGEGRYGQLLCFERDNPRGFVNLLDSRTGKALDIPREGLLVSAKAAAQLALNVGSAVTMVDASGSAHACTVAGVFENYAGNLFVFSQAQYQALYGTAPTLNALYLCVTGEARVPQSALASVSGFLSYKPPTEYLSSIARFRDETALFVLLLCGFALLLATAVLLNLMAINVRQRAPELAVLRINGFAMSSLRRFLQCDALLLMPLGIILGLPVGAFASARMLNALESVFFMVDRGLQPLTVVLSCAMMILFTLMITGIALRGLHTLDMTRARENELDWGAFK